MTLAIDISNNNGTVVLAGVKSQHRDLVAVQIKATEGLSFLDGYAGAHFADAERLGLVASFYHFARPEREGGVAGGVAEADFFLENIWRWKDRKAFGLPVLDYETKPDLAFAEAFCKRIEQKLGVKPIIYFSGSRAAEVASRPYLKSCPGWIAAYGPSWSQYHTGQKIVMWQYTDRLDGRYDASQVFVHPDELRANHTPDVLIVSRDGHVRKIRYGKGRISRFIRRRLPHLLALGKRVTLRRRRGQ